MLTGALFKYSIDLLRAEFLQADEDPSHLFLHSFSDIGPSDQVDTTIIEPHELPQSFKQLSITPLLYSDSDLLLDTGPAVTASFPYCGFSF